MTTAVVAFAQDSVSTETTSRNKKLTSTISGYPTSPTKKVSGTNESFAVSASISDTTNTETGKKPWASAWITSMVVTIGGETVATYSKGTGPALDSKSFSIRWDTTHFGHGETKEIKAEVKWHLENYKPVDGPPPIPTDPPPVIGGGGGSDSQETTDDYYCMTSIVPEINESYDPPQALETTVNVSIYNYASFCEIAEYTGAENGGIGGELTGKFSSLNDPTEKVKLHYEGGAQKPEVLAELAKNTLFWIDGHGTELPSVAIGAKPTQKRYLRLVGKCYGH